MSRVGKERYGMQQIKCPHCGKEFTIDEASYADILSQVKTREFDQEVHEKLELYKKQQASELALMEQKARVEFATQLAQKEKELFALQAKVESSQQDKQLALNKVEVEMREQLRAQEDIIKDLQAKTLAIQKDKELEAERALALKEKELNDLKMQLNSVEQQKELIKKERDQKNKEYESQIQVYVAKISEAVALGKQAKNNYNTFKTGKCPTCGHDIDPNDIETYKEKMISYLSKI